MVGKRIMQVLSTRSTIWEGCFMVYYYYYHCWHRELLFQAGAVGSTHSWAVIYCLLVNSKMHSLDFWLSSLGLFPDCTDSSRCDHVCNLSSYGRFFLIIGCPIGLPILHALLPPMRWIRQTWESGLDEERSANHIKQKVTPNTGLRYTSVPLREEGRSGTLLYSRPPLGEVMNVPHNKNGRKSWLALSTSQTGY